MKPYYTNLFRHVELDEGVWQLTAPLGFVSSRGELVVIPPCRKWNGASVPKFVRWLYPPNGSYLKASCVHDEIVDEGDHYPENMKYRVWDIENPVVAVFASQLGKLDSHTFMRYRAEIMDLSYRIPSPHAHRIMLDAMAAEPNPTPLQRRLIIWAAVRAFGPRWSMETSND